MDSTGRFRLLCPVLSNALRQNLAYFHYLNNPKCVGRMVRSLYVLLAKHSFCISIWCLVYLFMVRVFLKINKIEYYVC